MKKGYDIDDQLLLVATAVEIKIFIIKKNERDNRLTLLDTELHTAVGKNLVSKIVQLNKNGRVFYGGGDGHVNELKFEDNSLNLLSIFANSKKRVKKNDLQEESILARLIPSFLKFSEKKQIVDIKIDEQRHMLYSLASS